MGDIKPMKVALALILALISSPALASTPVRQSGNVTPRHVPAWTTNGVVQDGGSALNGFLSEVGITRNGGCALGINSGPTNGPYTQFCFGVTSGQGYFNLQSFGGAPAATLGLTINGVSYPFPGPGNGDVLGPPSSIDGDAAVFNGTGGTLLKDGGPAAFNVQTNAALVALTLTGKAAGYTVGRSGYYATGDSPLSTYTLQTSACSLNGGLGDGGSQVASATSGNCWVLTAQQAYDPRQWGAVNSTAATTATVSGSSLTLANAQDFRNGEGIAVIGAGAAFGLPAPGGLTVTPEGGTGSTTYFYTIAPIDVNLGVGAAIGSISILNGAALLGIPNNNNGTGSGANFGPPVWNQLAWGASTGAISYAIYEGSASNNMTCIGVSAKLTWPDYGANPAANPSYNNRTSCPSWVPASPPASAQADVLRGTIVSGAGTTSLQVTPAATTAGSNRLVIHDSGTQFANAMATGLAFGFGCGDYTITSAATLIGGSLAGNYCTTLHAYMNVATLTVTGPNISVNSLTFDRINAAAGFTVSDQAARTHWRDIEDVDPYNMIEITASFSSDFTNWRGSGTGTGRPLRGDYGVWMHGVRPPSGTSTFVQNPFFTNVTVPQTSSACSFVIDGDVNGVTTYGLTLLAGPCEYGTVNTVSGLFGAEFSKNYSMAVNEAWGVPMSFSGNDQFFMFNRLFLQGQNGNGNSGVFINSGAGPISFEGGTSIFGNDKHGIDAQGNELQVDSTTTIYANSAQSIGTFDKVHIGASATGGYTIHLAAGDKFAGTSGATNEKCGVEIVSGFNGGVQTGAPLVDTDTNGPGTLAPVCDETGLYGQVKVDGTLSPNFSSSSSATGVTIAASQIAFQASQTSWYYRSAQNATQTDTTDVAGAIIAAIPNAVANTQFQFTLVNLGTHPITLAGGTGVTILGMANSAINKPHVYDCQVANLSPAFVTCTGRTQ